MVHKLRSAEDGAASEARERAIVAALEGRVEGVSNDLVSLRSALAHARLKTEEAEGVAEELRRQKMDWEVRERGRDGVVPCWVFFLYALVTSSHLMIICCVLLLDGASRECSHQCGM